jgi:hypothetical protein
MKYFNLIKRLSAVAMVAVAASSCSKTATITPIGDAGQTIVKLFSTTANGQTLSDPGFTDLQFSTIELKLVSTPVTYDVVDVRREVPSSSTLNTTMVVKVKNDPGIVTSYNSAYGASYVPLPDSLVTIDPATPLVGTNYTVTLNPGEFAKQIKFVLKSGIALDLGKSYAMGFSIVSADDNGHVALERKKIIVEFGVRNQWDGKYQCDWTNYHPTLNPGYTGGSEPVEMRTSGATKVKIYFPGIGGYYCPAFLSGAVSAFSGQEPEYSIAGTNAVTVQNSFPGTGTLYTMAAGYTSRYDVPTKTFYVKWGYSYAVPGVFDATCREWTQKITYLGPR